MLRSWKGDGYEAAVFARNALGEAVSGDLGLVREAGDEILIFVLDALGHGERAYRVARTAEGVLEDWAREDPQAVLESVHQALRGSVGAVASAMVMDRSGMVTAGSVGNISTRVFGADGMGLPNANGTLGLRYRKPHLTKFQLTQQQTLVVHSDGVHSKFSPKDYPGLFTQKVSSVSKQIVLRFGHDHDDATCLVVRRLRS
jgi:hypothetical protein